MAKAARTANALSRAPARALSAAQKEFAAKGFTGARMDVIAKRVVTNKRMLCHSGGVSSVDAAHHGAVGLRFPISKRSHRIFEKVRDRFSSAPNREFLQSQFQEINRA